MVGGRSLHQTFSRTGRSVKGSDQQSTANNVQSNQPAKSRIASRLNISSDGSSPANANANGTCNNTSASKSAGDESSCKVSTSLQRSKQQSSSKWSSSSSSSSPRNRSPVPRTSNNGASSSSHLSKVLESKSVTNTPKNTKNHNRSSPSLTSLPGQVNPEMFFLIKEHAKTLAAIDKITKRLSELEVKVHDIFTMVSRIEDSSNKQGGKRVDLTGNQVVSDDSGGEYSRTTTGTGIDDDELLSLLNYIAKISDNIKAQKNCFYSATPSPMRRIPETGLSAESQLNHGQFQRSSRGLWPAALNSGSHQVSSPLIDSNRLINEPSGSHSFSALLFESNVDRFLDNLDIIAEPKGYFSSIHHPLSPSRRLLSDVLTLPRDPSPPTIEPMSTSRKQLIEHNFHKQHSNKVNRSFNDNFVSLDRNKANWTTSKQLNVDINSKPPKTGGSKEQIKIKNPV